jgi:hypothetical protein
MSIAGNVDLLSRTGASGWAADPSDPDKEVQVAALMSGKEIARVVANRPRPDLQKTGRFGRGQHGFSLTFPLQPIIEGGSLTICPVGSELALANGTREFEPIDSGALALSLSNTADHYLKPLILTHIPRSGSTLLMDILSGHDGIIVARHYPYEVKVALYYAMAAQIMTNRGDHEKSGSPTEFMRQHFSLPFNPYNHAQFNDVFNDEFTARWLFDIHLTKRTNDFCRSVAMDYYNMLSTTQNKTNALYFAEKSELNDAFRARLRAIFPELKEIVLVRDFRDTYCSYKTYFSKSGFTRAAAMQYFHNSVRNLLTIREQGDSTTLFIRYEDCLTNPDLTLRSVYEFLDLSMGPISVEDDKMKLFAVHATSESPIASIGRWKHELVGEERGALDREIGPFLQAFGYEH